MYKKFKTFLIERVLGVHDTPHRIALGVAVGMFAAWMPLIGCQLILTLLLATILRANKVVGLPFVFISNPFTAWLYIPNYLLGHWLLGGQREDVWKLLGRIDASCWTERFTIWIDAMAGAFGQLLLGSFIIALLLAVGSYFVVRQGTAAYRRRRSLHRLRLRQRCQAARSVAAADAPGDGSTSAHQSRAEVAE